MGQVTDTPAESTIRRRVSRGIALLDEKGPSNWRDRIDLDRLDLGSLYECVIGQVYGGWDAGSNALFGGWIDRYDEQVKHGFEGVRVYDALTEEWTRRLTK